MSTHPACGDDPAEPDGAIADHGHRHTGCHLRGIGGVPPGAHHVGRGQQAGNQIRGGDFRRCHQGALGHRDPHGFGLAAAHLYLCRQDVWNPLRQSGQVPSEAKKDAIMNWPGLTVVTSLPTASTMPQYSCPKGVGRASG